MSLIQNDINIPLINNALADMRIEVPEYFKPTLQANRHMIQKFLVSVVNAVRDSLMHPDTAMRGDISRREVDARLALAFESLRLIYFEEKVGLHQALDILPNVLIDTLRYGFRAGVMTDGRGCSANAARWAVGGAGEQAIIEAGTDLNAE